MQINKHYYLYRHIRLDKYEPFYIGIGTKTKSDIKNNYYSRSLEKRRNNLWQKIYKKTSIKIEILFECDDYSLITNKEKQFIKLYGRKDLKTGTLTNLTDGGELNNNRICSEELRIKRSINAKNRWKAIPKELRKVKHKDYSKKTINTKTGIIYKCIKDAYNSEKLPFTERHFRSVLNGKYRNNTNFKLI